MKTQSELEDLRDLWRDSQATCVSLIDKVAEHSEQKNAAYRERNQLVALISTLYPSVKTKTEIPGWNAAWTNCIYVALPTGQASWHVHDDDMNLFHHLPFVTNYIGLWDGHTTEQKYERIRQLVK